MRTTVYNAKAFIYNIEKILIIITIGVLAKNKGLEATDVATQCQPFSSLFLWQTGTGEDGLFILQYRLLVISIGKLPANTNISIVTIGAEKNIRLNFIKQAGQTNWRDTILNYKPGNASNYAISNKEINQEITNYYRGYNSSKAEIVYILVNNKTEVYYTENDLEELNRKKTFIILSGIQTKNKVNIWLKLATTKHHFVEVKESEDIGKTANAILVLSCQDSIFVCDTDMYWWYKKGCNTCTYICSKICAARTGFCLKACPYFLKCEQGTDITKDTDDIKDALHEYIGSVVFANSGLFVIFAVIALIVIVVYRKRSTFIRCINFLRRKFFGCLGSNLFLPGVKDKALGDRRYIFDQSDSPNNEQETLIKKTNVENSSYSISDMELKVLS